ncbi:MAG: hypothetical protein MJ066_03920 [Clostridia bacterium]|nr:hypothetical protein [Clostridia bacterium]
MLNFFVNKEDKINKKPFEFFDIFIYVFILVLFVFLLLFLIILPKKDKINGFYVVKDDKKILTYSFKDNEFLIDDSWKNYIEINKDDCIINVFLNDEKTEFNVIQYDLNKKSVKMKDSTCSISKDCTYFSPITTNNNVIYCNPHNIKILPIEGNGLIQPVVG